MNGSGKKIPNLSDPKLVRGKEFEQAQTVPICWKCDEIDPVCARMRVKTVGDTAMGA